MNLIKRQIMLDLSIHICFFYSSFIFSWCVICNKCCKIYFDMLIVLGLFVLFLNIYSRFHNIPTENKCNDVICTWIFPYLLILLDFISTQLPWQHAVWPALSWRKQFLVKTLIGHGSDQREWLRRVL